jgi:hypothetical protein
MQDLMQNKNFILPMSMEIGAWWLRFPDWFLSIFEFLLMLNLSASGELFWLLICYSGVKAF